MSISIRLRIHENKRKNCLKHYLSLNLKMSLTERKCVSNIYHSKRQRYCGCKITSFVKTSDIFFVLERWKIFLYQEFIFALLLCFITKSLFSPKMKPNNLFVRNLLKLFWQKNPINHRVVINIGFHWVTFSSFHTIDNQKE